MRDGAGTVTGLATVNLSHLYLASFPCQLGWLRPMGGGRVQSPGEDYDEVRSRSGGGSAVSCIVSVQYSALISFKERYLPSFLPVYHFYCYVPLPSLRLNLFPLLFFSPILILHFYLMDAAVTSVQHR